MFVAANHAVAGKIFVRGSDSVRTGSATPPESGWDSKKFSVNARCPKGVESRLMLSETATKQARLHDSSAAVRSVISPDPERDSR